MELELEVVALQRVVALAQRLLDVARERALERFPVGRQVGEQVVGNFAAPLHAGLAIDDVPRAVGLADAAEKRPIPFLRVRREVGEQGFGGGGLVVAGRDDAADLGHVRVGAEELNYQTQDIFSLKNNLGQLLEYLLQFFYLFGLLVRLLSFLVPIPVHHFEVILTSRLIWIDSHLIQEYKSDEFV